MLSKADLPLAKVLVRLPPALWVKLAELHGLDLPEVSDHIKLLEPFHLQRLADIGVIRSLSSRPSSRRSIKIEPDGFQLIAVAGHILTETGPDLLAFQNYLLRFIIND